MVTKEDKKSATIGDVKELIDNKKESTPSLFFSRFLIAILALTFWQSSLKIYHTGINESTIAGVGLGASTIIGVMIAINWVKDWFPKFLKKVGKNLNNSEGSK